MSESNTNHNEANGELTLGLGQQEVRLDKLAPAALLFGIVALLIMSGLAVSKSVPVETLGGSWLFGWVFWFTITMGMFGLSILHHTVRATWTLPLLRVFESGGGWKTLLVMGGLLLPLVIFPGTIYEWAHADVVAKDHILQLKSKYLNHGFWAARYVFYFAAWAWLAWFMSNSVKRQDENLDVKLEHGRSSWGAAGLVFFVITLTFAVLDYVMSLEPHWYSTMYGVWLMVGSVLGGLSFSVVLLCVNAKKSPYSEVVSPALTKDLGNWLFAFTMLWAYTSVSQFLIIWNGNIPETTQYFIKRSLMGWNAIGMVTIVGQFLVPWMTLLSPRVKRYPHLLRKIAGWIFVIHIVDVYLLVAPGLAGHGAEGAHAGRSPGESIIYDILSFIAVGGIWLAVFATNARKNQLLVKYDTRLQEALHNAH